MPRIRPSRGTHITIATRAGSRRVGAIVPAGGGRTIFALPWLGRTLVGTTDNDYEGCSSTCRRRRGRRVPARRREQVLRDVARARAHHRRLRGRAPADLDRRPEEVGRHLAQGGAVRDQLGPRHDHRRQAHDLAPDGEAGGRPGGRARGPRGALPHARDPARACRWRRTCGRPAWTRRASALLAARYGHAASDVLRWRRPPRAGGADQPDLPDMPPRPRSPPARSRRSRSATFLSPHAPGAPRRAALCAPDAESRAGWPRDGRSARLGRRPGGRELAEWREVARAEGLVPAASLT